MSQTQFEEIQIGYSVHGAKISAYANNKASTGYIYLIAGVHGDEPEGVFVLNKLFADLQLQNITKDIVIIPALNPDGLAARSRVNGNAIDLNRNWPTSSWSVLYDESRYNPGAAPLSEPENIFLNSLFEIFKPQLIFSFHTLRPLLDYNVQAKHVAEYIAKYNNYPIADYIGYPTNGSLGAYVDEVLHCGIITYELPSSSLELSMDDIWLQNEAGLKNYFLHYPPL